MKKVLLIAGVGTLCSGELLSSDQQHHLFGKFMVKYDKNYEASLVGEKFIKFKANLETILTHNKDPKKTYSMGVNQFSDLSPEEFARYHKLKTVSNPHKLKDKLKKNKEKTPILEKLLKNEVKDKEEMEVDWVTEGVVTGVQNQGGCGSSYAFSAVAALESIIAIKTDKLERLSEQQLVDCSKPQGNEGCGGGLMDLAYEHMKEVGGIMRDKDYRYTAKEGECKFDKKKAAATIKSYSMIDANQEALEMALRQQPVAVAVSAGNPAFQFYRAGVISTQCGTSDNLDHTLTLTGMGATEDGIPFYHLKNSWSKNWGEEGYVKIARGLNTCGLEESPYNVIPKL